MRKLAFLSAQLLTGLVLVIVLDAQGLKTTKADKETKPRRNRPDQIITISGETVEYGIFRSKGGNFSIAIPELPKQIIDKATDKAKAKGIDTGKQFVWVFERTLYTIYYNPPVDKDGNPYPQEYADIENGTRKGILNGGATLTSEIPLTIGKYRGTEFRYILPNGVRYISRIYLVGDMGYQVVGGYAGVEDEKKVSAVLDSFTLLKEGLAISKISTPKSTDGETRPGEVRLNSSLGKLNEIATKGELEPRTKRFRMDIPFLKAQYSPPTSERPGALQYLWNFDDAVVVISVVISQPGTFTNMSAAGRKQTLADFLTNSMTSIGAQKISEKDVSTSWATGFEVKVKRVQDTVTARSFIVGDMYISVSVATVSADMDAPVKKLFDSLEFLK
jgi:hypothetical protein